MSFASEPGQDDSNLPPVNVVVPDDARELDRDVLAYRREQRAQRRRQRLTRLSQPLRVPELGGNAAVIPLIAICLAISLVGGALLSVLTMSSASAPTLSGAQPSPTSGVRPGKPALLPAGSVELGGATVQVRSLVSSAIALVPAGCDCGTELRRLAGQAVAAHVKVYFAAAGPEIAQLGPLTNRFGGGAALAAADTGSVLTTAYHPNGLTVLLVFKDATAAVARNLPANFQLTSALRELGAAGQAWPAGQAATAAPSTA